MNSKRTRRRLLKYAGVGLATSLAGCNDGPTVRQPDNNGTPDSTVTPPSGNNDTDDEVSAPPQDAAGFLQSDAVGEFAIRTLPDFRGPTGDLTRIPGGHSDDRIINVTVDETTVQVSFTAKLRRDIDFTLYIRDANRDVQTKQAILPAPEGEMTYEDYTLTFDISDITLPRDAGGYLEIVASDSHPGYKYEHLFKSHQFVGVEYNGGTRWFNNAQFNVQNYRNENDGIISKTPGIIKGLQATQDNNGRRTVFLVTRTNVNGEVFGVSTTVDKGFVRQYKQASERWRNQHFSAWECHWATRVSHLQELARKTHAAITGIGITKDRAKLNALGDLIQMIPYGTPIQEECPPIIVLHETEGDCSEKSSLMAGILVNDPWNIRTGYVDAELDSGRHWTLGIDERDFDAGDGKNIHWVNADSTGPRPANLPNTRYAYFEMTSDTWLGYVTGSVRTIEGIYDTGTFDNQNHGSDTPPNY